MFRNITVNGFDLEVAKVRFGDNGFVISGLTEDGYAIEQEFNFADGVEISFGAQKVVEAPTAPVKKERKARKPKAAPEVAEVAEVAAPVVESVEVPSYEEYLSLTSSRGRGRPSKAVAAKIAAYKAAHNIE